MDQWQVQTPEKPLYPDVIWSKPDNPNGMGKLLIIGGSANNFSNVARTYTQAESADIGTIHLLVPEVLRPLTKQIPFIDYAPNNPSGSFARRSLAEFLDLSKMADAVLLAGDLGKNSETSLLLDDFFIKSSKWIMISAESISSLSDKLSTYLIRPKTIICLDFSNLRSLLIETKSEIALTSDISKANLAKVLHGLSSQNPEAIIIFKQNDEETWVCYKGNIAESKQANFNPAKSISWLIGQPEKPFQAIVSSMI